MRPYLCSDPSPVVIELVEKVDSRALLGAAAATLTILPCSSGLELSLRGVGDHDGLTACGKRPEDQLCTIRSPAGTATTWLPFLSRCGRERS